MLDQFWNWLRSCWPFGGRWKAVLVDDVPTELDDRMVYLVREDEVVWQAVMSCPCGCGATIQLCCLPNTRPRWTWRQESGGDVTLHPSVWRKVGCRSHFFLRSGRIVWC
ncbi:DUF6527 family protein [Rubripirellula lacrimiformis]|uniref:DUF6527 family protein n=1 Tax=Rubripirellula lacrimiformis TaxID=1930273 RepID=UPI001FEBF543|nr:DUF6527 family protein [Rubripirellula lacrimiformis]